MKIYETKWKARNPEDKDDVEWNKRTLLLQFPESYHYNWKMNICKSLSTEKYECVGLVARELIYVEDLTTMNKQDTQNLDFLFTEWHDHLTDGEDDEDEFD